MDLSPDFINAVKGFEGFSPNPAWDYRQYTWGYGTKAPGPNGTISQDAADAALRAELGKAGDFVESVAPNAPQGVKNALASLTYNAGTAWAKSGLGDAVRAGDWDQARE